MNIEKLKEMRVKNNVLWLEIVQIAEGHHGYAGVSNSIDSLEKRITSTARALSTANDDVMINELLETLEQLRIMNNSAWMKFMRFAFKVNPTRMKTIMGEIAGNDEVIAELRKEKTNVA